ncbi:hypothetical protein Goe16_02140 [Bacillus phage vB_BsuM-Goe16]|nr:hypothetical protein Goe16_00200 [Bacillus phage vB_BsuM-Goe16]WCS68628.1 hypothetical protein Goe16_02140 [Bacillus phage vB_BsuM-Goe16]
MEKRFGKWSINAEDTGEGIELVLEGETLASLSYDRKTDSFKLVAYGEGTEPAFEHTYKL